MTPQKKKAQIQQTFDVLKKQPMTTKMIQVVTGIPRENLTRYIAYLERRNKVVTVEEKPCEITGHRAKYYSTEQAYFPSETQSELFEPVGCRV